MNRSRGLVFSLLVFVAVASSSVSPDVEYFKIGCFVESPTDREFLISAGDYQPSTLTPYKCVKLCGNMKYNFAALQNGNLCFCAKTFTRNNRTSENCSKKCTGDGRHLCGGMWANSVYNSTLYTKNFVINSSGPLEIFESVNLTAGYLNSNNSALRVSFNIGDGAGESPLRRSQLHFRATVWGKVTITARSSSPQAEFVQRELYIHARPARTQFKCPKAVRTHEEFRCIGKIYEGTLLQASWRFQHGIPKNISLPDPLYTRVGTLVPQWNVTGLKSEYDTGMFLISSFHFSSETRLLALEMYGHTAGNIKVFIVRPLCNSSMSNFCLSNLSCSHQQCPTQASYQCISPDIFCASQACCRNLTSGNCSKLSLSSTLQTSELTISADLGVFTITKGYNLFVLAKHYTVDALPGDMLGWAPALDGKIAQQQRQGTVYQFSGMNADAIQTGSNFSSSQSIKLPGISYMISIIGSQASTFMVNHQYNASGEYWAQVNFTDALGTTLVLDTQSFSVQTPLNGLAAVYPEGFSFLGVQANKALEMTVNISTDSAVSVSWTLVNSSSLVQSNTVDTSGEQFALDKVNYTFNSLGTYIFFVEAWNNVSLVNTSVLVIVLQPITNLSVYLVSSPVYLGAESPLKASVIGTNVKYQWEIRDGEKPWFSHEDTFNYTFPRAGYFNVTVTASNLASSLETSFLVEVVQSLGITVPSQGITHLPINSSCSLTGPFDQNQYYYWDFGDGRREEGRGKTQVTHAFTKPGKYMISVQIVTKVKVNVSSEIFILEPVSGLTIENVTGVELFDRKTFIAHTATGNNLTYEWYFWSNSSLSIIICSNSSTEFHFNSSGMYTIGVNVSNSISSEYITISFPVQQPINGLKITAFPNPTPSNTTITFNVTKGTGTYVKYRLDFGDGFVVRDFDDFFIFNRTFSSGQWQIILTAENAVSHVMIFYNVTVEDPAVNITTAFDAEREFGGQKIIAVGENTRFYSNVSQGTNIVFHWNFGDNNNRYAFKGSRQPSGQTTHVIDHVFSREGQFNVSVNASNAISQLKAWMVVFVQEKIEGFDLFVTDRTTPGQSLTFRFSQIKGGNVSYIVDFGDNESLHTTEASLSHLYNHVGIFNVTATAVNQISAEKVVKTITVEYSIEGLAFQFPIAAVKTSLSSVIGWKITSGSNVKFIVHFGDSSMPLILDSEVVGMKVTLNHTYLAWGDYPINIKAYNFVGPNRTITGTAVVDDPIIGLMAYTHSTRIRMFENAIIVASVQNGSRVNYHFRFGDGSNPVNTTNNTVSHRYALHGQFQAIVTAHNSVTTTTSHVNTTITVATPNTPLAIRGLNISCQPTIPGNVSTIFIRYDYGFSFQCELSFGDGTKTTFNDSALGSPIQHSYHGTGAFKVTLQCGNDLGSQTVHTTANVDEVIEGLKFKNGKSKIEQEFGKSVKVEWVWSAGSNLQVSVTLSGIGSVASQITGRSGFIELDSKICTVPGKYIINIELSNSITSAQKLKATVFFVERISNISLSINPITRTGFPLVIYVAVTTGSNLNVRWAYGDGSVVQRSKKGYGSRRFDESHIYTTHGVFLIEVSVSNAISQEVAFQNVIAMTPVQGFTFHQDNSITWPARLVQFKFSRDSTQHLNATYMIEFGDGEKSEDYSIDPKKTLFTHSYSYSTPGCYKARVIIQNFVSRLELTAPVQIVEEIRGATLTPLQSQFAAQPDSTGGGPDGNTFPLEYPVSFTISQDTGTCLLYDWSFGDYGVLTKVITARMEHAYPLQGSYSVVGKVYNKLGTQEIRINVTLQHSVMGLYLATSGPGKPGETVTFVVFCASQGTDSIFVFNSGQGKNVTLSNFRPNLKLKAEVLIDPKINLPFDPSRYYATVHRNVYNNPGLFLAEVWAWNDASRQSARASVLVTEQNCFTPRVTVIGGNKQLTNNSKLVPGVRFTLTSRLEIDCGDNYEAIFNWVVYRVDTDNYWSSSSLLLLPPESGREVSLPPEIVTNQSSITILESTLVTGAYIFQLTVTGSKLGASNADQTYIWIADADIQARIAGGDLRTHNWEQRLVLDASESRDTLGGEENLSFAWYCSISEGATSLNSDLGCFGNGEGKVEYTRSIYIVEARRLFESMTYVFTVNVSSLKSGRWSEAGQSVIVLPGKPPNIKIRCESNCGKYLHPSKRLVLTTTCTNCDGIRDLLYNWSAEEFNGSIPFSVWPERARTPQNFPDAVILEDTFRCCTSYRIRVAATRSGSGPAGFAEYYIVTSSPPNGGQCDVIPKTGVELKTKFVFTCKDWHDEDQPLNYEIYYSYPGQHASVNSVLAFSGPLTSNVQVVFSAGDKAENYAVDVIVTVKDAYGASVNKYLPIQVKPRKFTYSMISRKAVGPGNDLERMFGMGATQEAVQLIAMISTVLNDQSLITNDSDIFKTTKQQIRSAMIQYLADFHPQTLDGVLLRSQALQLATQIADEITVDTQLSASNQYASMSAKLKLETLRGEDGGLVEKASRDILLGVSNVLVASVQSTADQSVHASLVQEEEEVASVMLEVMDEVSSAVLYSIRPQENPLVLTTGSIDISLCKQFPANLAGMSLDLGREEKFILPLDKKLMSYTQEQSYVTLTMTALSMNPFTRSNTSKLIKTKPLSLVLKGADGSVIPIEGLTSPIEILLPQNQRQEQVPLNISHTPLATGELSIHKVSVPNDNSNLQAEITPCDGYSELIIYLRYSEPPTLSKYDWKTSLPNRNSTVGPYWLFVSRDHMKGKGDYYIGVLPSTEDNNQSAQAVNYTFDVTCSACYFWDEHLFEWSSEGCVVHEQTTRNLTHCSCSHLTWFGGDLFIPPNKLHILTSIKKIPDLYKYPGLLATFCTIICLYIVGLLWARRRDRQDLCKVGLLPVLDNVPDERYRYEVTVYTARGKNTGTTANVSLLIAGEERQSATHVLKCTSRSCLLPGGVDSFLITTPDCLGKLEYIRIWHDNTGKSPSWLLSQVVIRDIETDEKFFFLSNNWLACDEGDGQVDRIIPVAGKDQLRDFVHLFKSKTSRDFSDGHLWFSIAFRPVRSRFTCAQRVSCCLSLLMCSMLANVMWYRRPVRTQNNVLIDLGFFEFTWHEILIGIQSSLIVFPINLLIAQLFRRIAVSPKTKQKYVERTRRESHIPMDNPRKQTAISLSDITPTSPRVRSAVLNQKQDSLQNPTCIRRSPGDKEMDALDDDFFCSLLESEIGLTLSEGKHSKPRRRKLIEDEDEDDMPDVLSSDVYYFLYKQDARDHEQACPESICSGDSGDTTTSLVNTEKSEKKQKKKRKLEWLLPWWFVYIAWFLCGSTAMTAGFFTLLFGLSFDKKLQEEWLVSMFVSIAQDVFVSQPLKVITIAIFFALLLKKPQDEEDDTINAELARDEEWLEQTLIQTQKADVRSTGPKSQRPPDQVLLHAARVRLFKERSMRQVIREIVLYFLFVWVVLLIAYGHRDPNAHFMTQNMENMFVGRQETLGPREDEKSVKTDTNGDLKFLDVNNVNDFWEWANQTLVPGLYNGAWYNGQSGRRGFLSDKTSFVVGVARIRQLRVKSGTCEVSKLFTSLAESCDKPYSWNSEDQTLQYAPGWKPANQSLSSRSDYSAWRYRTTTELKTRPFLGNMALYRGGGYNANLGPIIDNAYHTIKDLKTHGWIDKYTRAIFVEFTVYNSQSNLYCVANLLLELTAAGGSVPFVQLLSTRIDRYVGNFLLFVLICEVSFLLFTIFFTVRESKKLLKSGVKKYLTEFWNWIELAFIGLSWTSIFLYFIRLGIDQVTRRKFREDLHQFMDFHYLATADQLYGYVYAFVVFMMSVKFLRLFRFNRRMSLLGSTLKCATKELCHFGIVFSLVFVGFSHLCYLLFSRELYKFHTFLTTAETLLSVMLGKFSYVSLERTNRVLGPVMFFFYSVGVVFILINMFLSIIIENFRRVKRNNDLQSNEHEIVDFMMQQFMHWLGVKSRTIFRNRVVDQEINERPKYKKHKKVNQTEQLKERVDRLATLIKKVHFNVKEDEDFLRNDGEVTYLVPEINLVSYA